MVLPVTAIRDTVGGPTDCKSDVKDILLAYDEQAPDDLSGTDEERDDEGVKAQMRTSRPGR